MSTARANAEPSTGWMLWTSSWMLSAVIPGAMFTWLGLLVIGIVGRLPRWIVAGVAIGAAALLAALPIWGQWQSVVGAIVYLGGMLLALAANPSWLRARWARSQGGTAAPAATRSQRSSKTSTTKRSQSSRASQSSSQKRTAAKRPAKPAPSQPDEAAQLAERAGASTAQYFAAADQAAEPIDVNTADARALAGLPGFTRARARDLIRQRDKRGGFTSIDAFATAAGLQPHELVRLRQVAVCSPPSRGPRQFGRRVDY